MPPEIPGEKKRLGPGDPESVEFAAEIFPSCLGILDNGHGWAQSQPGDKVFQALFFPLGQDLNPAVPHIPDPPRESKGNGPTPRVVAEKNSLHAA